MPDLPDVVTRLVTASAAAGEAPPFSDQTLVDLRAGRAVAVVAPDDAGVAVVHDGELELVVGLEARGRGIGTALVRRVLASDGMSGPAPTRAWAHGDAPAARALAEAVGWSATRRLLQLRAPIPEDAPEARLPADSTFVPFVTGAGAATTTEAAWLALNAIAFAHHPEQGRMSLDDLRERESEQWFDPADVLLLADGSGSVVGSCWLKVEPPPRGTIGEFYAVAVHPSRQGQGVGGVLMRAGFARLAGRGLEAAALYVEGDNTAALALYRRTGFVDHAVDVQYAAP
ncbi:mycothiol synthase [Curtobacterium sp. RRHDQ10]|uniref:mycothiol synthase n=1 Tax=Curtobacterium phyllosphaerae TaxID=3413379 RepID=UPI003BF358A4